MAIEFRAPSNKQNYDLFWYADPAFIQGEGDEHDRKLEQARETGDWSALLIQGQSPTKFVARQIPSEIARRLTDKLRSRAILQEEWVALIVRLAIVDVSGFGDFKFSMVKHDDWGRIASTDLIDALDKFAPGCCEDLAVQIHNRMRGLSGK